MSGFGTSRFTAFLASVAICGMAATFWWAIETRSEMREAPASLSETRAEMREASAARPAPRAFPAKFSGRATDERRPFPGRTGADKDLPGKSRADKDPAKPHADRDPGKSRPDRFELMGGSEHPAADRAPAQHLLVNDTQGYSEPPRSQNPPRPIGSADMPLPALAALPAGPDPVQLEPARLPTKLSDPPALAAPEPALVLQVPMPIVPPPVPTGRPARPVLIAPDLTLIAQMPIIQRPAPAPQQPAENPRRQPRGAAAGHGHRSYYMEKYLEEGEYRFRRRPCEPPNMPDVCFMPQSDDQPVVVARP